MPEEIRLTEEEEAASDRAFAELMRGRPVCVKGDRMIHGAAFYSIEHLTRCGKVWTAQLSVSAVVTCPGCLR